MRQQMATRGARETRNLLQHLTRTDFGSSLSLTVQILEGLLVARSPNESSYKKVWPQIFSFRFSLTFSINLGLLAGRLTVRSLRPLAMDPTFVPPADEGLGGFDDMPAPEDAKIECVTLFLFSTH